VSEKCEQWSVAQKALLAGDVALPVTVTNEEAVKLDEKMRKLVEVQQKWRRVEEFAHKPRPRNPPNVLDVDGEMQAANSMRTAIRAMLNPSPPFSGEESVSVTETTSLPDDGSSADDDYAAEEEAQQRRKAAEDEARRAVRLAMDRLSQSHGSQAETLAQQILRAIAGKEHAFRSRFDSRVQYTLEYYKDEFTSLFQMFHEIAQAFQIQGFYGSAGASQVIFQFTQLVQYEAIGHIEHMAQNVGSGDIEEANVREMIESVSTQTVSYTNLMKSILALATVYYNNDVGFISGIHAFADKVISEMNALDVMMTNKIIDLQRQQALAEQTREDTTPGVLSLKTDDLFVRTRVYINQMCQRGYTLRSHYEYDNLPKLVQNIGKILSAIVGGAYDVEFYAMKDRTSEEKKKARKVMLGIVFEYLEKLYFLYKANKDNPGFSGEVSRGLDLDLEHLFTEYFPEELGGEEQYGGVGHVRVRTERPNLVTHDDFDETVDDPFAHIHPAAAVI
jgi:hypothetical protein